MTRFTMNYKCEKITIIDINVIKLFDKIVRKDIFYGTL